MDATPQLAMGAALTMRTRSPLAAFGIGVASHAVLDAIPHYHLAWITGLSGLALVDVVSGTCLALIVAAMAPVPWSSLSGALGGIFPEIERVMAHQPQDLLEGPPFSLPHGTAGLPWGVLTQLGAVLIAVILAARLRRTG